MLDQIAKTKNPSTRQALVETFTNSYFQDLTTEQRQSINSDLFSPEKNDQLVAYVGALNETNTAQIKEKALEDTQREAISSAACVEHRTPRIFAERATMLLRMLLS